MRNSVAADLTVTSPTAVTFHLSHSEAEMTKTFRTAGFYAQKLSGRGKGGKIKILRQKSA